MAKKSTPELVKATKEIQAFGTVVKMPLGLSEKVCLESVNLLNQVLADSITLKDLYKKHHWQLVGPTFYQLHLLFDKHYEEQDELVDLLAERIQTLGGVSLAMGADVAKVTKIAHPPKGREEPAVQISRLLEAHEVLLKGARHAAKKTASIDDQGSNDILVSDIIRTNEKQVWFISEHLVQV